MLISKAPTGALYIIYICWKIKLDDKISTIPQSHSHTHVATSLSAILERVLDLDNWPFFEMMMVLLLFRCIFYFQG